MSMLRFASPHHPTTFLDLGPSVVIRHGNGIEAEPIGSMRPVLTFGGNYAENRSRTKAAQAFSIHPENRRDRCAVVMTLVREPCARTPGHRGCHRTAEWMRSEARNRSTRKVWA